MRLGLVLVFIGFLLLILNNTKKAIVDTMNIQQIIDKIKFSFKVYSESKKNKVKPKKQPNSGSNLSSLIFRFVIKILY